MDSTEAHLKITLDMAMAKKKPTIYSFKEPFNMEKEKMESLNITMATFMKANSKITNMMVKEHLHQLKEFTVEISEGVFRMVMDSLNGKMDPFTEETIIKVNDKETDNFIIVEMEVLARAFGKEESSKE